MSKRSRDREWTVKMKFAHDGPPLDEEHELLEALSELPKAEVEADQETLAVTVGAKTPKGTVAIVPEQDLMPLVVSEAQEDVLAVLDDKAGDRSFSLEAVEILSAEEETRRKAAEDEQDGGGAG